MNRRVAGLFALPLVVAGFVAAPGVHEALSRADVPGALGATHTLAFDVEAIACPAGYDNAMDDDVCITYAGAVPGPTLVTREDDVVSVTLTNRIADTVASLGVPASVVEELEAAAISFHTHGVSVPVAMDGVPPIEGTNIPDSSVAREASFTYTFTTPYAGAWHYHDHVMGPDGSHGQHRGLYGSILVLDEDEAMPDSVLDLHLLDTGPHGGLGLGATVSVGERFDLVVVGLGNHWWSVTVEDPTGAVLATLDIGPGVSFDVSVDEAVAGAYQWTASTPFLPGEFTGEVVAQ